MFVRVKDKANNRFYKSLVYGLVNCGLFEQAIVRNSYTNCFELVHHLEKADPFYVPVYEVIQPERNGWLRASAADLLKLNMHSKEVSVDFLFGYEDVLNNHAFLSSLLDKKCVRVDTAGIKIRDFEDGDEWNYIVTQADADVFMNLFEGFHDSYLNKLMYEEDDYKTRKVTAIFDNTCWYGVAELCFEGLIAMNLRPAQENVDRYIYGGTLLVKDECVFWADDALEEENLSYEGSYIKALNLKWRKNG